DILNTYTVGISIGQQVLKCTGTRTCLSDSTPNPQQVITAAGATAKAAVNALLVAQTASYTTSFEVQGLYPSAYYGQNSDSTLATGYSQPSYYSKLVATATPNSTGSTSVTVTQLDTSGSSLVFRGPAIAFQFKVLAQAQDSKCPLPSTFACHGG